MCVSRFNPTEPCCGDEPGCQVCSSVNWERYAYTVSFERTELRYGTDSFHFQNGQPYTRDDSAFAYAAQVWLQANQTPLFSYGNSRCHWTTHGLYRGVHRYGDTNPDAFVVPDYAAERSSLLAQWNAWVAEFGSTFSNWPIVHSNDDGFSATTAPGQWYWFAFQRRVNSGGFGSILPFSSSFLFNGTNSPWLLLLAEEWARLTGRTVDEVLNSDLFVGQSFGWMQYTRGAELRVLTAPGIPSEFRFQIFGNTGGVEYETIALKDWRCHGPNVFHRVANYTGSAVPQTVTIELKPKRDANRLFHAARDLGPTSSYGTFIITQLPDT